MSVDVSRVVRISGDTMAMAEDFITLTQRRDTIQQALDVGARTSTYQGRTIEYRSAAEMRRIITDLNARIAGMDPTDSPKRMRHVHIIGQKVL